VNRWPRGLAEGGQLANRLILGYGGAITGCNLRVGD
jgi:hypothetical protein